VFKPHTLAVVASIIAMLGWLAGADARAAGPPRAPVPKAAPVILTLSYAGGLLPPQPTYLQIESDGTVIVTPLNGPQKRSRLTPRQLDALLVFIGEQRFLNLTSAGIQKAITAAEPPGGPVAMITDGTTTTITLNVGGRVHSVSVYAADSYLQLYPNKPLAEFVAIEHRLQTLANSIR